jgi:hypothetical protein
MAKNRGTSLMNVPFSKIIFSGSANCFGVALNAIQFLVWLKIFGPVQNSKGHLIFSRPQG